MARFKDLKAWREKSGLGQGELSERAKVSRDLIRRLERGEDCTTAKVFKLYNALNEHYTKLRGTGIPEDVVVQ